MNYSCALVALGNLLDVPPHFFMDLEPEVSLNKGTYLGHLIPALKGLAEVSSPPPIVGKKVRTIPLTIYPLLVGIRGHWIVVRDQQCFDFLYPQGEDVKKCKYANKIVDCAVMIRRKR